MPPVGRRTPDINTDVEDDGARMLVLNAAAGGFQAHG